MRQVTMATTALALSFVMCAAYVAFADQPAHHERVVFASVDDLAAAVRVEKSAGELPSVAVDAAQEPSEAPGEPDEGEAYSEPECYEPGPQIGSQGLQGNPEGLNSYVGVIEHDGHVETAYSSNVAYHTDTAQWSPDEQGFYRTQEGYYVVASSDYEQGAVIETSQGKAMVLDDGCSNGVVDFYTNW